MTPTHVKVLGRTYSIRETNDLPENTGGECAAYADEIKIRPVGSILPPEEYSLKERRNAYNETLRHEIFHAFFFSAGLQDYSMDEQLIDWLARMYPEFSKSFKETGCER